MKIRLLNEKEIEVRIASVKEKGVILLLYKDVRCDWTIVNKVDKKIKKEPSGVACWGVGASRPKVLT